MKRIVGTIVLFVLLLLTAFALVQMDAGDTSAFKAREASSKHAAN